MPVQVAPQLSQPIESTVVIHNEGDIYSPLRRVRDQYYNHANKLAQRLTEDPERRPNETRQGIEYYRTMGDRVHDLIPSEQ